MTITNTTADAQGQARRYDARHLDDAGTPAAYSANPGFRPKYVKVINLTDRIQWEWYHGMTQGHYLKTVAAGTRTLATDSELSVEVDVGQQPSITLAASVTLQNKQYQIIAEA